ncbi:hypothetical protein [Halohasta litorea]|uniref:Uncharacterized protein n=1 Tax=Halohasta litorea TaxID=869891 RepID=A0ABD6DBA3_9EURY|nr:hypothetical protein [Halohasta litorea]
MSNATSNHEQNTSAVTNWAADVAQQGTIALKATVRGMSFWAAILLPLVYLPLLSGDLGSQTGLIVIALIALHLIALFVGHNHTHTNQ